ncbi:RHS repeat-associated core domain-containing protein [Flavobacterium sp.]|uniref:RHS repeat-associated core domain-containing protein n=1 Tax=Flavobacterium sp. TaxID=239 RepID=UPI003B9B07F6
MWNCRINPLNASINDEAPGNYKYLFNGQEFQEDISENNYAMTFRAYDPALGRFTGVDLLAELQYEHTPYHFGYGNPNVFADPSGLFAKRKDVREYMRKLGYRRWEYSIVKNADGSFSAVMTSGGETWHYNDDGDTFVELPEIGLGGGGNGGAGGASGGGGGGFVGVSSGQGNGSGNWYTFAGRANAVFGTTASALEAGEGSFRLATTSRGFSPKYYGNAWKGNQFATTYNISKVGNLFGKLSLGFGVAADIRGMMIHQNNPNSPNAVHPSKAVLNTGMGVYGLWVNPFAGALYFGVDAFYPGGWPAALERSAEVQNRDRAILGFYPKD